MIQPTLDIALANSGAYEASYVHAASVGGRRVVMVGIPTLQVNVGAPNPYPVFFVYDLETQVWTRRYIGGLTPTAVSTQWGEATPVEIATVTSTGYVNGKRWFAESSGAATGAVIRTFPTDFDGKKVQKQLNFVRIQGNYDQATPLSVNVYVDETQVLSMTAIRALDPVLSIYGPDVAPWTYQPVDGSTAFEWYAFPNYAGLAIDGSSGVSTFTNNGGTTSPVVGPIQGFRFSVEVTGGGGVPCEIYAIDVCYSVVGDGTVIP